MLWEGNYMSDITTKQRQRNKDTVYYINSVITIIIMFGFGMLPPFDPITPLGMKILGIFLGLLYGWTFVDQVWPSILGMIALSLTDYMSLKGLMAAGFGSNTVMLMWFMLIIAALVDSAGVSKFIAIFFISRKFVLGKPWLFITTFLFVTFILSAMTSTVPAIIVCWGILYSILKTVGYKPGDTFSSYMVIGVVYSCLIGLALLPWKTVQMVVLGMFEKMAGYSLDYVSYIFVTLPVSIVCIIAYVLLGKLIIRPDVQKLKAVTRESFDPTDLQVNFYQKIIIVLLVVLVILLLMPSIMPAEWAITGLLKGLGAHGVAFLIMGLMIFLRFDGKPMLNFRKAAGQMQWDSIFLTAAMMPFADALNVDEAGINAFLVEKFGVIFGGTSPIVFTFLVLVVAIISTQFMNNSICGAIMFPIMYPFAVELGIAPGMITVLLIYVLVIAVLTPAGSPMSAIMFSNSEWVTTKEIYKYIAPGIVIVFVSVCLIGIPIANIVFR